MAVNPAGKQAGFTLSEVMLTLVVLGAVSSALAGAVGWYNTMSNLSYTRQQEATNQSLIQGLLDQAAATEATPAPYTGAGLNAAVYNPGDTTASGQALVQRLTANIAAGNINGDGNGNARVYQRVTGLKFTQPLYGKHGPTVDLNYDYLVLGTTDCQITMPCYSTAVPGVTSVLTAGNYRTYQAGLIGEVHRSTLLVAQRQLARDVQRLDTLRSRLRYHFNTQRLSNDASDPSNWYPTDVSISTDDPSTNSGCQYEWTALTSIPGVLNVLNLTVAEHATLSGGGDIEYCPDLDIGAVDQSTRDMAPHYAALRIHRSINSGNAPDSTNPANNVILPIH